MNLQNALLDNAMIWYELESPNHSKASKSPRSSISDSGKGGLRGQNIRSVSGNVTLAVIKITKTEYNNNDRLQKNASSMAFCIQITRTWRILDAGLVSRNNWTSNRIS